MTPATRPAQRHVEARVRAAVRCRRRARRVDLSSALIGRSHVDVVRLVLRAAQSRHLGAHGRERNTRDPSQCCPLELSGAPATPHHAPSFWRVAWQRLTQEVSRSSRTAGRRRRRPTRKLGPQDRHSVEACCLSTCSGGREEDEEGGEKARERGASERRRSTLRSEEGGGFCSAPSPLGARKQPNSVITH